MAHPFFRHNVVRVTGAKRSPECTGSIPFFSHTATKTRRSAQDSPLIVRVIPSFFESLVDRMNGFTFCAKRPPESCIHTGALLTFRIPSLNADSFRY